MGMRVQETAAFPEEARGLVTGNPRAGLYQHPRWIEAVLEAYPRFTPRYLVLEEDGATTGVTPVAEVRWLGLREVVSMPFGTHGGPVLAPEASVEGVRALNARFAARIRRAGTFRHEMTVFDPPEILARDLADRLGDRLIRTTSLVLDLTPGAEAIWNRYDQRLRRSVRIAGKSGVFVREEEGGAGLETFCDLYEAQARTWSLTWHHSRGALRTIVERLGPDARIWIAGVDDRPLCAQLALYHQHREIQLWLSGALEESRPVAAFHLMLHRLVEDGSGKGYETCNFGSSLGDRGVDRFKRAFGAVDRPLWRLYHQAPWAAWIQRLRWGRRA